MKQKVLRIHPNDNVLVALQNLVKDQIISFGNKEYKLLDDIPAKHKFFVQDMQAGDPVFMYGVLVGRLQSNVATGSRMTTGNTRHAAEPYNYRPFNYSWQPPDVSKFRDRHFMGYHRADGRVGTANYWLFIPTVFCENRNLDVIRELCGRVVFLDEGRKLAEGTPDELMHDPELSGRYFK